MILFPAIDLIGGKVVRLERGDRSRCKVYSDDPVAVARSFAEQGTSWVHVVDLSAAFGEDEDACAANSAAIKAICGVDGLSVDVGGGVRSLARIDELAGYGARRIALGTVIVTEPGFAEVAGFPVVASGGISTLDDIRALAAVGEDAIEGAITGRALYEGNFTLAQALAAARGEE